MDRFVPVYAQVLWQCDRGSAGVVCGIQSCGLMMEFIALQPHRPSGKLENCFPCLVKQEKVQKSTDEVTYEGVTLNYITYRMHSVY